MVYPRVNEYPVAKFFASSGSFSFTRHISAIMNKMVNFKHCNFTSKAVSNLSLQENRTMLQATTFMT